MKTKILLLLLLTISILRISAQNSVNFILHEPVIDGYADENLPGFVLSPFKVRFKSSDSNPDINASYYLAYNAKSLYLYIEAQADSITIRDRGYQNGDGFHLVIGKPQTNDQPTDEFYVLAFSAEESWCHQMVWYYNIDLNMRRLSGDTKFKTESRKGKISFELLLPWKEVYPYHPLMSDQIGFNLCFIKAVNEKDKNYNFIVHDNRMQSEQSKRRYITLNFQKPDTSYHFASSLKRNNIKFGEEVTVKINGFAEKEISKNISVSIVSGENSSVVNKNVPLEFSAGKCSGEISLNSTDLIPGGYKVRVAVDKELLGEHFLSIFTDSDIMSYRATLESLKPVITEGTFNTLMFNIGEIESSVKNLKEYENSFFLRKKMSETEHYINMLGSGDDLLKKRKGFYRRAYFSNKDSAYYPYSIYIPEDYSADKKYPLLVYLHGSGNDDRVLSVTSGMPAKGYIILAPNGRGTSNCFAGEGPQEDIKESISDVIKNFNIDTTSIILSGFSMGGYGVYRTFYEQPQLFRAIAVISGHPDLARVWNNNPEEINFLDEKNLSIFKGISAYIFHGEKDMNCPYYMTVQLVNKLKSIGCDIIFDTSNVGHSGIPPEMQQSFFDWLNRQSLR